LKEESLDLNKALNICRSHEAANQQLEAMKPDERKVTEEVRVVKDRNDKDRHKHRSKPRVPHNDKKKTRSDKKR